MQLFLYSACQEVSMVTVGNVMCWHDVCVCVCFKCGMWSRTRRNTMRSYYSTARSTSWCVDEGGGVAWGRGQ